MVSGQQQGIVYSVMKAATPAGPGCPSQQASASLLILKKSSMQQVHCLIRCHDKSVVNMTIQISSVCHAAPVL